MNITKHIIVVMAISFILAACDGIGVSEKLNQIDTLIVNEQYDSANVFMKSLEGIAMKPEEQAHYNLLSTQLNYLTNHPLPSDSLLDQAFIYYNKVENKQKLAEAYYYKSYRARKSHNYSQAIVYGKEAEHLAKSTADERLQFKITENLAYLNGLCENDLLQLQYAKKALAIAKKVQNNNWMAYSYNIMSFAFENLNQHDSACFYIEQTIPYVDYVSESNKAAFLMNIGLLYKNNEPAKAKELFEKALTYEELPEVIEHLADVYYAMGDKVKAYELWKEALTKNSRYDKINLIHSIISYDLERGNIDEVSRNVDEIIHIKDSILNKLKNDTIKDLQLRFDNEVAMHEADMKVDRAQKSFMGLAIALVLMAFYVYYRKKKAETKEKDLQDLLYAYTSEISKLTTVRDKAAAQISELKNRMDEDSQKIVELEKEVQDSEHAIDTLNKDIKQLLDGMAPKLKQGRMLYDQIMEGGNAGSWSSKQEKLFNDYYAAINYQTCNRLRKVERETKLNPHNLFYLILKEMDKDDAEIMRIMVLSPEGLRSIRKRTKPVDRSNS